MTLVEAILAQNEHIAFANAIVGALIRPIDQAAADAVADGLLANVATLYHQVFANHDEALWYFLAVMAQESGFDKKATNLNAFAPWNVLRLRDVSIVNGMLARAIEVADAVGGTPAEQRVRELAKPKVDRDGRIMPMLRADLGIAMFNGAYAPFLHDTPSWAAVVATYLFDPAWSIPAMAKKYAGELAAAAVHYPLEDTRWVATGLYNAGAGGFANAYADKTSAGWVAVSRHMGSVRQHYEWFKTNLTGV